MDPRKAYYLDKIGRSIPKELLKKGMDTVQGDHRTHEMMEYVAKKSGDKKLMGLVKSGQFLEKERQVMSKQGDRDIQEWVDVQVAKEMKRGVLKPASNKELQEWNPSQGQ